MTQDHLPLRQITWDRDAVWIQRVETLFLVADTGPNGLNLRTGSGAQVTRSAEDLALTHDATEAGQVYKAKADPMQAFRPRAECRLAWDGQSGPALAVTGGAVAVRRADGSVFLISAEQYQSDYAIVAQAGGPPPR